MPDVNKGSTLLASFKNKIEESLAMVPNMTSRDKLEAAQCWNMGSNKLQEMMNKYATEINADQKENEVVDGASILQSENLDADSENPLTTKNGNQLQPPPLSTLHSDKPAPNQSNCSQVMPSTNQTTPPQLVFYLPTQTLLPLLGNPLTTSGVDQNANAKGDPGTTVGILSPNVQLLNQCPQGKKALPRLKAGVPCTTMIQVNNTKEISVSTNLVSPPQQKAPPTKSPNSRKRPTRLGSRRKNLEKSSDTDFASSEPAENQTSLLEETENANHPEPESGKTSVEATVLPKPVKASRRRKNICGSKRIGQKSRERRIYICNVCNARYVERRLLIDHCRKHTGETPFECEHCGKKFASKRVLEKHAYSHTGAKPWQCGECGICFALKKSLGVHMRRHTGEKPYKCNVCDKSFRQSSHLKTHKAIHQKGYSCKHCSEMFATKEELVQHMTKYKGLHMFKCTECPAKFLTKAVMENHKLIHTGERPFLCELCGSTFMRQQNLNEHMNRHYGRKPYKCKLCDKSFAEMSALCKHKRKHATPPPKTVSQEEPECSLGSEALILAEGQDVETETCEVVDAIKSLGPELKPTILVQMDMHEHMGDVENEVIVVSRGSHAGSESMANLEELTINILTCASDTQ